MRERREIPAELLRGPPAAIVRLVVPHRFRLDGGVLWTLAQGDDGKTLAWERYANEETATVPLTVGVGSFDGICGIVQRLSETCPDNGETCVRWEPRDVDCGRSAKGPVGQPVRCIVDTDIVRVLFLWFMTPLDGPLAPHPVRPLERFSASLRRRYELLHRDHDHETARCLHVDAETRFLLQEGAELRSKLTAWIAHPLRRRGLSEG